MLLTQEEVTPDLLTFSVAWVVLWLAWCVPASMKPVMPLLPAMLFVLVSRYGRDCLDSLCVQPIL